MVDSMTELYDQGDERFTATQRFCFGFIAGGITACITYIAVWLVR